MSTLDWVLVFVPLALVLLFALYTQRFMHNVADFLAGGRVAGRYLIANAFGESAAGVANTLSKFEMYMVAGFVIAFWNSISVPIQLLVAMTGFVVYRYRQTRALTLAQFFEMRYSRRFRLFMGMLAFVAGIMNYGIFPAVSSRFFVYFLGLPQSVAIGSAHIQTTALIMASYLLCVLVMLMLGGQISLMVTDCAQGIVALLVLLIMIVSVLMLVGWPQVTHVMGNRAPDHSMINPFDAWAVADFNAGYVLMALLIQIYSTMAMQNTQGFNSAGRNPHESRMGAMLGNWRLNVRILLLLSITTAAVAYLHTPSLPGVAEANALIKSIPNAQIQKQMTITAALRYMLPPGIKGLFCSTMVMGLLAGDCSHMHSWSSIFVQDVILPLRKRPFTTRQHLWVLRLSLIFVAGFAFVFSMLWTQTQYIALWWQITSSIFISGAGAAIIGGLYWRKGGTGAAWSAVIVGSVLSFSGILLDPYWNVVRAHVSHPLPAKFPLNGIEVGFIAALLASGVYVVVSLLTCKIPFELDRLLHRGRYAPPGDIERRAGRRSLLARMANIDESFTPRDRFVAMLLIVSTLFMAVINAVVCALNVFAGRWSPATWSRFWLIFGVIFPFVIGAATFVWFTIGGIRDTRDFFRALRTLKRDANDDGRVAVSGEEAKRVQAGEVPVSLAAELTPLAASRMETPSQPIREAASGGTGNHG